MILNEVAKMIMMKKMVVMAAAAAVVVMMIFWPFLCALWYHLM